MSLRRLTEKTRARLVRETGAVYKPHADRLRFAVAFPNTYYVGMSNLGMQLVYRLLNDSDDVVCERVFLPDRDDIGEYSRPGVSLFTMESQTPVKDFDVLGFSLSYELDYPNVIRMISLAGLPLTCQERDASSSNVPLIIAGGPAATFNPEPLAQFIDVFVIGEAEAIVYGLVDKLLEDRSPDRVEFLRRLAQVEGVYVPRFYTPEYNDDGTIRTMNAIDGVPPIVRRQRVKSLREYPATTAILTPETEFSNMVLAEVARGCGRQCRFCVAGYSYLPPRARPVEEVMREIRETDKGEKSERPRVGLLSASVFDHPGSALICQSLADAEWHFSISSTRADTLSADVVEVLRRGGHETLTIAPEAGTNRLRWVINKCITDEQVLQAAERAWEGGFRRLKLYFMVGLPTETEEDVEGIADLVMRVKGLFRWERIAVSISCFVPKPWTPFQWAAMVDEGALGEKLNSIRSRLRSVRGVEAATESPREAVVQGVLARGDRRVGDALRSAAEEDISWRAAFRSAGVDPAFYTQRQRELSETLPWDHIDLGVRKQYLWREWERALEAAATASCLPEVCRRCGVCCE